MKKLFLLLVFTSAFNLSENYSVFLKGHEPKREDSLSLVFVGDIMGHGPQIKSAYDSVNREYNYENVFRKISPLLKSADFTIGNLELTLAGEPYTGYPFFSSPDKLADACKKSGINVMVTANNHSCDRGEKGITRTLHVLDSLEIKHTGTFRDSADWKKNNLLILNKNNFKVGILNYTYGTNGLPIPKPTIVNLIDTISMASDLLNCQSLSLDKLIVFVHWGDEYQSYPSEYQKKIADFLFKNGADIIVGSHPHVLQKMEFNNQKNAKEKLIAYSLGNFVSNQRERKTDGGAILQLKLTKTNNLTKINDAGYYLTWVSKTSKTGKIQYEIIPCSMAETNDFYDLEPDEKTKIKLFISDSRNLFEKENMNVLEIVSK